MYQACKIILGLFLSLCAVASLAAQQRVTIGVLAYNGKPQAMLRWQPTADYLATQIADTEFLIMPLTHEEFRHAINKDELDFLLTNPGHYVRLEVSSGATRLATFQTRFQNQVLTQMSSVIFTRKDSGIQTLDDLKGKTLAAISKDAFGGYQLAQKVFLENKINPSKALKIKWLGFPHADIVRAVISGKADAGVVRAGILEKMSEQGALELSRLAILNNKNDKGFPFRHSTSLYPEWPIARLPSTDSNLAKQVVLALLLMPDSNEAAVASGGAGWTIPLDYSSVHDLFKVLQIEPYPPTVLTTEDFWQAYKQWIIFSLLLLVFSLLTLLRMFKANNRLNTTQLALQQQQNILEDTVRQRTDELLEANQALQLDIQQRIETEKNMHNACDTLQNLYTVAIRHDLSREQRLQSILDMARQFLGADKALLSRWNAKQQQFTFCTCSPESQIKEVPLFAKTALQAITDKQIHTLQNVNQWQSYLASPVTIADNYQCLFEFVIVSTENTDKNVTQHGLLNNEIHRRILKLLTLWISNEMVLVESEKYNDQQSRELQQRFEAISPRERQVLFLLVQGESNKSMARHLSISPKTVELHRANLLKKTHAQSSIQLVKMAIQSGLSDLPSKNPSAS